MSWPWAIAAGVALGVIYTLSPLTVLGAAGLVMVTRWAGKDLTGRERDWFFILFTFAIVIRFVVIGALLVSADGSRPYTVFFGDEWIFKSRPIWLRNVGLGIPISTADLIYAYDQTGMSAHLYVLAYLQALVGDAPYGLHVFNVMLNVGAVATLYRLVRASFGPLVAFGGSVVLLFLPSLFAWSVSVLKEPIYIAAAVTELLLVLAVARAPFDSGATASGRTFAQDLRPRVVWRVIAAVALVAIAYAMEELRTGSFVVVAAGAVAGWAGSWTLQKPARMLMASAAVPVALVLVMAQAPVQARLMDFSRELMRYHAGHVMTPGVSYKIIDPAYYGARWTEVRKASPREVLQFAIKAPIAFVLEPTPRNVQSGLLWAYLPEHLIWLVLIGLVPFGVGPALKRDRLLTTVLLAHAASIMMMVALTSGNIGTLIRHRGLSLPYLVWFSMLGATALIARAATGRSTEGSVTDGAR